MKQHHYTVQLNWTGNDGHGTRAYHSYRRDYTINAVGKPPIEGSSDPSFRGDSARYNPEELLVASLSSCHMLWYLHLCSTNQVMVIEYRDAASGEMEESANGGGRFVRVLLEPLVTVSGDSDRSRALELHQVAHRLCFVANSVNFPVEIDAKIRTAN